MDNLVFLKQCVSEYRMTVALEQLGEQGIPLVLFIARLRDIPVDTTKELLLKIDHAIILFGGKSVWLDFLYNAAAFNPMPTIGAHSDF